MKLIKMILIYLFFKQVGYAQEQNTHWYFGSNNGINFETNPSTVLEDGQIASSNSPATVSDSSGNLLFYTDGKSIWNKNHTVMQNGNNTLLNNEEYPNHSTVILPIPKSNKYYIFTQKVYEEFDEFNDSSYSGAFYFSIVNMDANNGLGNVETLNKELLYSSHQIDGEWNYYFKDHLMTTAMHSDGESYWLILKPTNNFYAFHITEDELENAQDYVLSTPIRDTANKQAKTSCSSDAINTKHLKTSPNSDKLAATYSSSGCLGGANISVYDFDNATGEIGYVKESNTVDPGYVSLDFSPNGDFIYVLNLDYLEKGESQANINVYNSSDPTNLLLEIPINGKTNIQDLRLGNFLQRGRDGNLYFVDDYATNKVSILKNADTPNSVEIVNDYLTFNTNVDQFPNLLPYQGCVSDFIATANINQNQNFNKSTQNTITATNTINSGAMVNYDAGTTVSLKTGFHAKSGATFKAFIEGCSTTSSKTIASKELEKEIVLEEENILISNTTSIYPNPTTGLFTIVSNEKIIHYAVFNSLNTVLYSNETNSNKLVVNIQSLPMGMYIVRFTLASGEIVMKKIIKN